MPKCLAVSDGVIKFVIKFTLDRLFVFFLLSGGAW
jgi:hypothetical protein